MASPNEATLRGRSIISTIHWSQKFGVAETANFENIFKTGARFSKAPETFRARKASFRSSVSKNGEVYTPETSCMKGTSLHL